MIQNIKVDVIYYKCPTDFEMEFNLCGCCRMRMLTDKAGDRSGLIRSLSRAVSRSRVIICSGPLFESDGLIRSVAAAIGKPLETVNASEYGIRGNSGVEIIKGSMPLVASDGMFGGCIIESGPQSIVILTESRSVRKSLMNSLIHPYIEELSRVSAAAKPQSPETAELKPADDIAPETVTPPDEPQAEPIAADAAEESAVDKTAEEIETTVSEEETEEANGETNLENEQQVQAEPAVENNGILPETDGESAEVGEKEIPLTDSAVFSDTTDEPKENSEPDGQYEPELYFEPEKVKLTKKNYYENSYGDIDEDSGYITGDGENYRPPRRPMKIALTVILLILLIAVIILLYILVFEPLRAGISPAEYFSELFESTSSLSGAGRGI